MTSLTPAQESALATIRTQHVTWTVRPLTRAERARAASGRHSRVDPSLVRPRYSHDLRPVTVAALVEAGLVKEYARGADHGTVIAPDI